MKKTYLSLLMALILCLFAACGGEKEPAADDPATDDPGTSDTDTQGGVNEAPEGTFVGVLDVLDTYSLVPAVPGETESLRTGIIAPEGYVQIASYSADGMTRDKYYEIAWADLGIDGMAWEYLGTTVELDITGTAPVLKNTPEKTVTLASFADLSFPDRTTVSVDGQTYDMTTIDYGYLRDGNLIEEGGWYIPKWNNKSAADYNSSVWRVKDGHYVFISVPLYAKTMVVVTEAKIDVDLSLKSALMFGDYVLGYNEMGTVLNEMLGYEKYEIYSEAYKTAPSSPTRRLEIHELFKFTGTECAGWETGDPRVKRMVNYLDIMDVNYLIFNIGRRDVLNGTEGLEKMKSAVLWLCSNYPNAQIILVIDQPYPDSVFATIGTDYTGTNANEHLEKITAAAESVSAGLSNVTLVNLGGAYMEALSQGISMYGTEGYHVAHPSVNGSYLAACMLYAIITGDSAVGTYVPTEVSSDTAAILQSIADQFKDFGSIL